MKKTNLKKIRYLSIFILAVFTIFGINYFGIIPLSALYPNELGWLPTDNSTKTNIQLIEQPEISNSIKSFSYDAKKAEEVIANYMKGELKSSMIPENPRIKQGLSIDNNQTNNFRTFGSYFNIDNSTISVNFHYKENTDIPNDLFIFIEPGNFDQNTLTPEIANNLLQTYFNRPYLPLSDSNCVKESDITKCEIFREESDGKKGFGVLIGNDPYTPESTKSLVFNCHFPNQSDDIESHTSCISI